MFLHTFFSGWDLNSLIVTYVLYVTLVLLVTFRHAQFFTGDIFPSSLRLEGWTFGGAAVSLKSHLCRSQGESRLCIWIYHPFWCQVLYTGTYFTTYIHLCICRPISSNLLSSKNKNSCRSDICLLDILHKRAGNSNTYCLCWSRDHLRSRPYATTDLYWTQYRLQWFI